MITDAIAFYIVDQKQYLEEAVISAESVRRHMPNIDTMLFSPDDSLLQADKFTLVYKLPERKSDIFYLDHTNWMKIAVNTVYEKDVWAAIYMDCDTYVCSPFPEVFDLLGRFDFLGVHAPGRQTTKSAIGLSPAFPEINLGFNPFKTNGPMRMFFNKFAEMYNKFPEIYGNNDQGALRDALWKYQYDVDGDYHWEIRYYVMPPEYNCRFNMPCFVSGEVKILHGHSSDIARVDQIINSERGMRSWKSGEINF